MTEVVASGGGTRNPVLMAEIARRMPQATVGQIDEYGVAEASKEALIMAVIGFLTMHGLPGTVPSCTGASRPVVLGSVVPGAAPLRLDAGAQAPRRIACAYAPAGCRRTCGRGRMSTAPPILAINDLRVGMRRKRGDGQAIVRGVSFNVAPRARSSGSWARAAPASR